MVVIADILEEIVIYFMEKLTTRHMCNIGQENKEVEPEDENYHALRIMVTWNIKLAHFASVTLVPMGAS